MTIKKARNKSLEGVTPSLVRFRHLSKQLVQYSLPRALQYEVLQKYKLKGAVLDFGGGTRSLYRDLIHCDEYYSLNIDPAIEPTWLIEVGESIPCDDDRFDSVLSLNTIEHIYDAKRTLEDMHRVLKPGGELVLSVPFLFPVHGHPDDYFRPTPSWYYRALSDCGFSQIDVHPLTWGPFSNALVCSGVPGPAKLFRKRIALALDLLFYTLNVKRRGRVKVDSELSSIATAYFVRAVK